MNLKEIREILELLKGTDVTELELVRGEDVLKVRRGPAGEMRPVAAVQPLPLSPAAPPAEAPASAPPKEPPKTAHKEIVSCAAWYAAPVSSTLILAPYFGAPSVPKPCSRHATSAASSSSR